MNLGLAVVVKEADVLPNIQLEDSQAERAADGETGPNAQV